MFVKVTGAIGLKARRVVHQAVQRPALRDDLRHHALAIGIHRQIGLHHLGLAALGRDLLAQHFGRGHGVLCMAPDLPAVLGKLLANQFAQPVRTAGDQNTFKHAQLRARRTVPDPNGSA